MPFLPPPPSRSKPLVAADAFSPVDLVGESASPGTGGEAPKVSNTVKGFEYRRWKMILYTIGTISQIVTLPLWPFFLAKQAKDWSIARNYFGTMRYCLKAIWDHVAYGSLGRMIKYNIAHGPDYVKNRIAQRRGACTRCAKCCRAFNCIFLGQDQSSGDYYCKVFGTAYWYYGTCGRYPIDQRDIDDHGCPGFSFLKGETPRKNGPAPTPRSLPVVGNN
ncbi:hypothetical protein HY251_06490 [bacterium]|nr:hypothetical protein [bacterium]